MLLLCSSSSRAHSLNLTIAFFTNPSIHLRKQSIRNRINRLSTQYPHLLLYVRFFRKILESPPPQPPSSQRKTRVSIPKFRVHRYPSLQIVSKDRVLQAVHVRCADDDPFSSGCEVVVEKFIGIDCGTLEETWANVFLEFSLSGFFLRLKRFPQAEEAEHEVAIIVSRGGQFDGEDVVINPSITRCDSRLLIFWFPEIS